VIYTKTPSRDSLSKKVKSYSQVFLSVLCYLSFIYFACFLLGLEEIWVIHVEFHINAW
jgi:hypothetical protein